MWFLDVERKIRLCKVVVGLASLVLIVVAAVVLYVARGHSNQLESTSPTGTLTPPR